MGDLPLSLRCFRERLVLAIGAMTPTMLLISSAPPRMFAPYAAALDKFYLFLWAVASLASLALVKSALRAGDGG